MSHSLTFLILLRAQPSEGSHPFRNQFSLTSSNLPPATSQNWTNTYKSTMNCECSTKFDRLIAFSFGGKGGNGDENYCQQSQSEPSNTPLDNFSLSKSQFNEVFTESSTVEFKNYIFYTSYLPPSQSYYCNHSQQISFTEPMIR